MSLFFFFDKEYYEFIEITIIDISQYRRVKYHIYIYRHNDFDLDFQHMRNSVFVAVAHQK